MAAYYWFRRTITKIKRFFRRNFFRLRHGFNYEDCWNLDYSLAKWLLPRLKHLKANNCGYPWGMTIEEWEIILGKMVVAFELILEDDFWLIPEEKAKVEEGLDLFRKHFHNLWD